MEKVTSKINKYRKVLAKYIEALAEERNSSLGSSKGYQPITDLIHNQFQLIQVNWIGNKYNYKILLHLSIHHETGNIWVLQNNTEIDLAEDFALRAIPKSSLVLGFRSVEMRALSEYAVM